MAKRLRKNREPGKIYIPDPAELNRWCIEMAMRWPSHEERGGLAGAYHAQTLGGTPIVSRTDADVIGRAKKIRDWVVGTL